MLLSYHMLAKGRKKKGLRVAARLFAAHAMPAALLPSLDASIEPHKPQVQLGSGLILSYMHANRAVPTILKVDYMSRE